MNAQMKKVRDDVKVTSHISLRALKDVVLPNKPLFLVSTNNMRDFRSVNAVHKLCRQVVAQILDNIRCGVDVAVTGDAMMTKAVGVLHT